MRQAGVSVSRLARQAGVNTNQLCRWVREHGDRQRALAAPRESAQTAFVPVALKAPAPVPPLCVQAHLPNGVVVDLRDCDLAQAAHLIEALGRLRCSASTKA